MTLSQKHLKGKGQVKIYEMITERITELLQNGEIPWRKPWRGGGEMPQNFISKKPYRGINIFILQAAGFVSPYFLSFRQAKQLGGMTKKGSKGYPVIFWKWIEVKDQVSEKTKNIPLIRYYTVFNIEQTADIQYSEPEPREFNPIEAAERIISEMPDKPAIEHNEHRAYYCPADDRVNMPPKGCFNSDEQYYSTIFHELAHSTGHESRLNRKEITEVNLFGSHDYSKEELVAEMAAAFLCGASGIHPRTIENSAAYIQGWLKKLRNDKKFVVMAAAKAQKAADYTLNQNTE